MKSKKIKLTTYLVLSFSMLFSLFLSATIPPVAESGVVKEGFEAGSTSGAITATGNVITTEGHRSNKCYQVASGNFKYVLSSADNAILKDMQSAYTNPYTATANGKPLVEISAWIKLPEGVGSNKSFTLSYKVGTTTGTKTNTLSGVDDNDGWMQIIFVHRIQAVAATKLLEFTITNTNGVKFLVDDIRVSPRMLPTDINLRPSPYTPPTTSNSNDFVKVNGNQLYFNGTPYAMDGINFISYSDGTESSNDLVNWFSKAFSEDAFEEVKNMCMNTVRLNMDYRFFMEGDNFTTAKVEAWAWLDQIVYEAKQNDIKLLLDMHTPPGGYQGSSFNCTNFWVGSSSSDPKTTRSESLKRLWVAIADRYKHEPTIMGFDIINEPRPCKTKAFYDYAGAVANAVRAVNTNHFIVAEETFASDQSNQPFKTHYLGTQLQTYIQNYGNVVYDAHNYDMDNEMRGQPTWAIGTPLENYLDYLSIYFDEVDFDNDGIPNIPINSGEYGIDMDRWTNPSSIMNWIQKTNEVYDGREISLLDGQNLTEYNPLSIKASRQYYTYHEGPGTFGLYNDTYGNFPDPDKILAVELQPYFQGRCSQEPPTAIADFSLDKTQAFAGEIITFTDLSSPVPNSWNWSFGDGTTSTLQNPTHSYTSSGTKTITLDIGAGITKQKTTQILVPVADFEFMPTAPTIAQQINFTNNSLMQNISSYAWDIGNDGIIDYTTKDIIHAFSLAGSYPVKLTVSNGTTSLDVTKTVTVTYVVNDIIIDDADGAPRFTLVGTWNNSSVSSGRYGSTSKVPASATNTNAKAIFTPNILVPGVYQIFESHAYNSNRENAAHFTITHRNGSSAVTVNQQSAATSFSVSLGEFEFNAGTTGFVTLTELSGPNGVNADALKFVYKGPLPATSLKSITDFNGRKNESINISDNGLKFGSLLNVTNYPNPFSTSTTIYWQALASDQTTLEVIDVFGRKIKTLVNEFKSQGEHTVRFDSEALSEGIYFYQLKLGNSIVTKKMMIKK